MKRIPEFISSKIQSVVFQLLFNPQLTIREHAAKTLATYITCSSITVSAEFSCHEVPVCQIAVLKCLS